MSVRGRPRYMKWRFPFRFAPSEIPAVTPALNLNDLIQSLAHLRKQRIGELS